MNAAFARLLVYCLSAFAICCGSACPVLAGIIADSVSDFSGVQGQNNWSFGYYRGTFTPATFQQMTIFDGTTWWVDHTAPSPYVWTRLYDDGGHPNGTHTSGGRDPVEQWAVRRWVSEVSGSITITGNIADQNPGNGNGIIGHIFQGNAEVYSVAINDGNTTGVNYSIPLSVSVGTTIDFAIDPRSSNDVEDSTRFTAQVNYVPEPSAFPLGIGGGLLLLGFTWRRAERIPGNATLSQTATKDACVVRSASPLISNTRIRKRFLCATSCWSLPYFLRSDFSQRQPVGHPPFRHHGLRDTAMSRSKRPTYRRRPEC